MPKDPTKNIARYKIEGGHLNEFEFQKGQEEFAEQRRESSENLIPGTPPEVRAEATREILQEAQPPAPKTRKAIKKKPTKAAKATKGKKRAATTKKSKTRAAKSTRGAGKKKPGKASKKKPSKAAAKKTTRKAATKKAKKK